MGAVTTDWRGAYIVPLYKRNGDKSECCNSRGVNLLGVVGKPYGRVFIELTLELKVQLEESNALPF